MSSGQPTSRQFWLPTVLVNAARLLAICFLVLQISIAGIAGKHAGALPLANALCLNDSAAPSTPAHQTLPAQAPLTHHHDSDCCFLGFSKLTPVVIAILAAYLTPPLASMSKPSPHLFINKIHSSPELSPLAARAPPIARI
jgi:hypothetical protein